MTTQEHSGSGDNVAGDKYVNILPLAPPPPLTGIPQNIPYFGTKTFVGRSEELEKIDEYLNNSGQLAITSAIQSVTGMGGVGKTELAVQYALRYQQNYKGGICWIQARSGNMAISIVSFCQSVDIKIPDDFPPIEKVNYCWNHWLEGNVLLIFDDVQSYNKIKDFLPPKNDKFKVIVTSRQRLGQLQQLKLQVLEPAEALELLRQIIGEERVNQELEKANQLCQWLGYLPLGLELVGRYLITYDTLSLTTVLERLEKKQLQARALLDPKEDEGDMTAQLGIASAFELSWQELSANAQKLGCYLSLFQAELFDWLWVESSNLYPNEDEAEQIEELERLRDGKLRKFELLQINLEEGQDKPLFSYHPLISRFFESKFKELEDREELKHKFCKSLIRVASSIDYTPTLQEIKKFTIAAPHLEMIATAMRENIEDEDIYWPFIGLGRFDEGQTDYHEAEKWRKQCLEICQQRFGDEHKYVAGSMNYLASLYYLQGKYKEAECLYLEALAMTKKLLGEEHRDIASSMNNLAALYDSQGKYKKAECLYLEALAMTKKLLGEEHRDIASSMNNLAELYRTQGKYTEAKPLYLDALAMRKKLLGEEHRDIASSMNNLALLYYSQGKYTKAEPLYVNALAMYKKLLGEEHPDVAQSLNNLALLYDSQGKYPEAEPLYLEAIKILENVLGKDHPSTIQCTNNYQRMLNKMG
jgi:tetratricopeptide (TPR) repeat protein